MKDNAQPAEGVEQSLARVLELYEQGKLLAAFAAGRAMGPIRS